MYHGVPRVAPNAGSMDAAHFEQQIVFLKKYFIPIHPEDQAVKRSPFGIHRVLITFDDGFRNNFEVAAPILHRHAVPAVFFVSSRHCEPGKYLWFAYLRCLQQHFKGNGFTFRGEFIDMTASKRVATMRRLRDHLLSIKPHPAAMYQAIESELPPLSDFASSREIESECGGMTSEQVQQLAADPLFTIGSHTLDHPLLTKCEPSEVAHQIGANKAWIENVTGRPCDSIAYPGGDYDRATIKICQQFGLTSGYAVEPHLNRLPNWEMPRMGIFSPSIKVLGFKIVGGRALTNQWLRLLHHIGLRIKRNEASSEI
jgi:peptidoglycan/xylan/chitin deacetylase (PgdA/CDA1 family)